MFIKKEQKEGEKERIRNNSFSFSYHINQLTLEPFEYLYSWKNFFASFCVPLISASCIMFMTMTRSHDSFLKI